jgi:transposase
MSAEYETRAAVLKALRAGRKPQEIARFLKVHRSLVYRLKKVLDQSQDAGEAEITPARKQHKKRTFGLTRTADFVASLQEKINEDPSKSMRALAKEMQCDEKTIRNCIQEDIRYKSYKMRRGHFMSEATKQKRCKKAKLLLNRLKRPANPNQIIFFSDEKIFSQDQKTNRQNDRWLCSDPKDVPIVMHTKFPASVMVLGVISSKGDVMPPHFFETGQRVNAKQYIEVLDTVVKPWMETVAGECPYVFQQDGAPAHTAKLTQEWLKANLQDHWPKEIWPPSSPDCNPLDYFMWSVCEREVNKQPHNTMASLKAKISEVMADMDRKVVIRACKKFRSRIEAVVDFIK